MINTSFELNLRECREIWEVYYPHQKTNGRKFTELAQEVYNAAGPQEFGDILDAIRNLHQTEDASRVIVDLDGAEFFPSTREARNGD